MVRPLSSSLRAIVAISSIAAAAGAIAQAGFSLKDGDRVVFYGDSITEQKLYTVYVQAFVATRFPNLKVTFINSGVGGDQVTGGWMGDVQKRVERDVKPYNASVVTVMLGMNDGWYSGFTEDRSLGFRLGYAKMLGLLQNAAPNARFTLIGTSPFDDVTRKVSDTHYNDALVKYEEGVKDLAEAKKMGFVDFNKPLVDALTKAAQIDPEGAQKLIPDRVHPGAAGHVLMAAELLKGWNAPGLVSEVVLDASAKTVVKADNAKVSRFDGASWTQLDKSLPFPIALDDKAIALAMKASDFVNEMDRQIVSVRGLASGSYELSIDGKAVGTFSSDELGAGVNIATLDTPMKKQAWDVVACAFHLSDAHNVRWRELQYRFGAYKGLDAALNGLAKLEKDIRNTQMRLAQPKPHVYRISKV